MNTAIEPVRLALIQNRLDHICRQMGWVMSQTALSPIFSQAHDFTCYITDSNGFIISQADGLPAHAAGGGFAARALIKEFGDDINEGDAFLMNDPYVAGGNHLPDWVIATPVFLSGEFVALACDRAHQSDIGGGAPGTYNGDATEIFHEGLRLPPVRLVERLEPRRDLWKLVLINSRTPELLDGDLQAMIGATRIGAERIRALAEELPEGNIRDYFDAVLDHADRSFRKVVKELPDGRYEGEEFTDNDCFSYGHHAIRLKLTVDGDKMTIDFTGTDPQMLGFKNSPIANTHSLTYVGLASYLCSDIPINEGTFRCAELILPEHSLVNPAPPAAQTMSTMHMGHEIVHAVWKALAKAAPNRACAGWAKTIHGISTGFNRDSEPYVLYHWNGLSGSGAVIERDGFDQIGLLGSLGGLTIPNAEAQERLYPIRIHRQEIRRDSGGPGERRGGAGVHYEAEMLGDVVHSFRSEGLGHCAGFGVNGGGDGDACAMTILENGREREDLPIYGKRSFHRPRFIVSSGGGGGWGDPLNRDPLAVLEDVRGDIVSIDAARDIYGVAMSDDGLRVDLDATEALRDRIRAKRDPSAAPSA